MIKRLLAGLFGAILFGVIIPITLFVGFESLPLDGPSGLLIIIGASTVFGFAMGCSFPKVFGFIFEIFIS